MKKMKHYLLLLTALLVSGGAWGTVHEVSTFSELTTAISSAVADDEIKLTAPITTTTKLNISKAITLNLGGFTLSNSNQSTMIVTNGNVTIKGNDDGVTPLGSIVNSKSQSTTIETDGGTLNIISGTIRNSGTYPTVILNAYASSITIGSDASIEGSTSYLSSGYTHIWNAKANASFTINNSGITFGGQAATNIINYGTMSLNYKGSYSAVTNNGTIVINGGTFAAGSITNNGTLTIEGGLFAKSDYESIIGYVAPGKELWETKNYYSVNIIGTPVKAKIGDYNYASLNDAITDAATNDEITMYEDQGYYSYTLSKSITLDLNGKMLWFAYGRDYGYYTGLTIAANQNVVIKDSKGTGQLYSVSMQYPFVIKGSAKLTLDGVNVVLPPTGGYCTGERISLANANAQLVVKNSKISCTIGNNIKQPVILGKYSTTSITIENSTINTNTYCGIRSKGSVTCTNATIDCDGFLEGEDPDIYGIYLEGSSANLTFNSGSITVHNSGTGNNATGIALLGSGPTATINGGTITADKFAVAGNGSSTTNSTINVNGGTLYSENGDAIYHPQTGTLNITGGTLSGGETALEIRSGTANITGGTLISRYKSNEEESLPNANGTTTMGVGIAAVQHVTTNPITVTVSGNTVIHALLPVKIANPQDNEEVKINTVEVYMNGGKSAAINGASTVFWAVTDNFYVSAGKFSHVPSYVVPGKTVINTPLDDPDHVVYPYMIGLISETTIAAQNKGDIVWEIDDNWKLNGVEQKKIPETIDNVTIAGGQNVIVTGKEEGTGDETDGAFAYSITIAKGGSLVVEDGAKLAVGGGGIIDANNNGSGVLVKAGGTLLISPDANVANAHPYGGVEFKSVTAKHEDGWQTWYERDHRFQLIGIPTMEQPEIIRGDQGSKHGQSIYLNTWGVNSGWKAVTSLTQFDTPFKGYCFWNDAVDTLDAVPDPSLKDSVDHNVLYTFKGNLVGNEQNLMQFQQDGYHFFANSYTAPIDIYSLLGGAENGVQKAVYILIPMEYRYEAVDYAKLNVAAYKYRTIAPMEGFFFLKKTEGTGTAPIDYITTVWSPAFPGGAKPGAMVAARRQSESDMTSVRISLMDNTKHRSDNVYLMASDKYSAQEDASDTHKLMNPAKGVNIYAPSNLGNLSTMQTGDLEGQYLAITTNAASSYTLSFDWVKGEELYLTDHVTGQTTPMLEGNTYTFSADPNTAIADRFEIVRTIPGVVTNVVTIADPTKNIHGIYTLMGQYVGESFDWNQLPNGVYVVNGQKVVK